jgi:predicted nuclease with TOPRIM domain
MLFLRGVFVSSVTAEDVVKLFESDERSRKRLAKLLLPEVVSEPDLRLAIINAVLRDVATKEDITKVMEEIEKGKVATREEIEKIRIGTGEEIAKLREDFGRLEERIETFRKEMYTYIAELRERVSKLEGAFTQLVDRIGDLDKRIDALDKRIDYVTKVSWALTLSVIATLVAQVLMRMFIP